MTCFGRTCVCQEVVGIRVSGVDFKQQVVAGDAEAALGGGCGVPALSRDARFVSCYVLERRRFRLFFLLLG